MLRLLALFVCAVVATLPRSGKASDLIPIVAAENVYGDLVQQIGGAAVKVTSILSKPDQDPHLFEISPSVARATSAARIVVYNGIGYDAWMEKLLQANRNAQRDVVVVADVAGRTPGDNPHLWYDVSAMVRLAETLAGKLSSIDPVHQAEYTRNGAAFQQSVQPILAKITQLRARLAGAPVTATEPVFGYMFDALGLTVRNTSFQRAVMNDTEPSASDVSAFETDLRTHRVRLLLYNTQASDPVARRMEKLARTIGIPVVGATETAPPGQTYQTWIMRMLDAIDHAMPR